MNSLNEGTSQGSDCTECENLQLTGTGGFSQTWPVLQHTWQINGEFNGMPKYGCYTCQGSRKQLIWNTNRWSIVDCLPGEEEACYGSHEFLYSSRVGYGTCLWNMHGLTWTYCKEGMTQDGCQISDYDDTVEFVCVDF
eukprot:TRINITY_DN14754_c0_g1_i4.p1 TRINITY_DN14754_c0_g1~~TRINITY_DN14754_c0_g1_i4.p1  ORF type:complete len:138 (-),score=4.83 TRINITY_DN14754_c0_g1_i4:84-497(-)